uniref:Uncharacterized protein n=1 Tax=Kalanchoe fedtschenkoi TaxID=63787 RepID=A0A7N0SV97_KALFE
MMRSDQSCRKRSSRSPELQKKARERDEQTTSLKTMHVQSYSKRRNDDSPKFKNVQPDP